MTPPIWIADAESWPNPVALEPLRPAPLATLGTGRLAQRADTGELLLITEHDPEPGHPRSTLVFRVPPDWDGSDEALVGAPFHSESMLYATEAEAPRVPAAEQEQRRKGWAW
jgi:hypothetical protein